MVYGVKDICFITDNVNRMWESLDPADKTLFNFDLKALEWKCFLIQALKGMRVYLLDDQMNTLPEGHKLRIK